MLVCRLKWNCGEQIQLAVLKPSSHIPPGLSALQCLGQTVRHLRGEGGKEEEGRIPQPTFGGMESNKVRVKKNSSYPLSYTEASGTKLANKVLYNRVVISE